jgi:hypothetical protein
MYKTMIKLGDFLFVGKGMVEEGMGPEVSEALEDLIPAPLHLHLFLDSREGLED